VKPSYGLADADIERMLRDSFSHAKEDVHARALAENKVEGQRLIEATRSAIQADAALLSGGERDEIGKILENLERTLEGKDHRAIKNAADALNRATAEFAARRMDAGIRRALAGRKIGSL
jgi:molecular chaperone HscA